MPREDVGQMTGTPEMAEGTSFESLMRHQQAVAALVAKDPNVAGFMSSVGGGPGGTSGNQGRLVLRLKPRRERRLSADQLIRQLTPKLNAVPGIRVFLQNPPPVRIGARAAKSQYQFTLQGNDIASLYENAARLETRLKSEPTLDNVTSDLQIKNPEVRVDVDRERAAAVGVTPEAIQEALYYAYGSRQVSTIFTPNKQSEVIMTLGVRFQCTIAQIDIEI